jgi:hypothetical protein
LGIRRLAFVVDDIDTEVNDLSARGFDLVGQLV